MPQPNRSSRSLIWLFIVAGVIAIGVGAWNLFRGLRSEHWPATEGVIQKAEMKYQPGSHGSGTYAANISYKYQIAGISYTGTRLAFGEMQSSSTHAQAILNRFPVGHKVPVHYDPDDPDLAVLETGIHGGTWLCFGVGTVFVLAGWMFLKLSPANPAAPTTQTNVGLQQPPILMGVIFALMGSFMFFMEPERGVPVWILYAAGGFFVISGLFMLSLHLQNKLYSKILIWAAVLTLLAVFHWVSFGPGERIGTATSPSLRTRGVNVKSYFAAFTILADLVLLAGLARRLMKGRQN